MKYLVFITLISTILSCNSSVNNSVAASEVVTMPDDAVIKKAIDNFYTALSFAAGKQPNEDSIKNCFITKAQLINFIADTGQILSIDDFIRAFKNYTETSKITFFKEAEMFGRTDQFGSIAQRISSYKTFANNADVVSERGVNSFQLIKTQAGWKISSIIWDVESQSLPIPKYYLSK